jgi:hypothetical protein
MRDDGTRARPLPMSQPGFDVEPRYAPNGRWIAFMRLRITNDGEQQQAIHIVAADGGLVPPADAVGAERRAPHVVTRQPLDRLQRADRIRPPRVEHPDHAPDGDGRRTILPVIQRFGGHKPWFSPDGSRILFVCATTDLDAGVPIDSPTRCSPVTTTRTSAS